MDHSTLHIVSKYIGASRITSYVFSLTKYKDLMVLVAICVMIYQ